MNSATGTAVTLRHRVNTRFPHLRFILAVVAAIAAVWAVTVAQTKGFELVAYGVRLFSTRGSRNPMIIAGACGLAAWLLAPLDERQRLELRLARLFAWPVAGHIGAVVLACAVITVSIVTGAFLIGGSDPYGYVSQANALARGTMRIEQPVMRDAAAVIEPHAFAPLGWRPSLDGGAIVPTYSFGYPVTMALAERVAGPRAVFYVLPVLAGMTILATYALGFLFTGPMMGFCAALLMATSPPFLFHIMTPMSDVPVTAWWTVTLALLLVNRRIAFFLAGVACGMAIITRPNIVPLAVLPPIFLLSSALRQGPVSVGAIARGARNIAVFAVGPVIGAAAVGAVNAHLYGSPFLSGYGATEALYGWRFIIPNLVDYSTWLTSAQTPLVWVFVLAPLVLQPLNEGLEGAAHRSTIWLWLAFIATLFACYLPYLNFEFWLYLRFLLPAFPLMFLLGIVVMQWATARWLPMFRTTLLLAVVGVLAWRGLILSVERGVLGFHRGERKFLITGEYIANHLPPNAALFSLLHSGSARYYSGRLTVRFDLLGPRTSLDAAVEEMRRLGYRPYLLLEPSDEKDFQAMFPTEPLARLDWPSLVTIQEPGVSPVRIWDPDQAPGPR